MYSTPLFYFLIGKLKHMVPPSPDPPPDLIDSEEEYEVDHIVSHKGSSGRKLYLTTWKRYPSSENTWEPEVNLHHAVKMLKWLGGLRV